MHGRFTFWRIIESALLSAAPTIVSISVVAIAEIAVALIAVIESTLLPIFAEIAVSAPVGCTVCTHAKHKIETI